MAVEFHDLWRVNWATLSTTGFTSAAVPVGDIFVVVLVTWAEGATHPGVTPPEGFLLAHTADPVGGSGGRYVARIYWKRKTASEPATWFFSHPSMLRSATGTRVSGALTSGDPWVGFDDNSGTGTSSPAVSLEVESGDGLLIGASQDVQNTSGFTPPTDFDILLANDWDFLATRANAPEGATGSLQITGSSSSNFWVTYLGALRAAPLTGEGSITAPAATLAGEGVVLVQGAGGVTPGAANLDGVGAVLVAGSGEASPGAAALLGSGVVLVTGSGQVTAGVPTVSGAGSINGTTIISGGGSLIVPPASLSGSGGVLVTGDGVSVAPMSLISGSGAVLITGTGEVIAPMPVLVGTTIHAAGEVIAPPAIVVGAGTVREPSFRFFPPVREEGPGVPLDWPHREAHRLFPTRLQGISLVLRDGVFVEKRILTEEDYGGKVNGEDYFIGGYRYTGIKMSVAKLLIESGFEPELE